VLHCITCVLELVLTEVNVRSCVYDGNTRLDFIYCLQSNDNRDAREGRRCFLCGKHAHADRFQKYPKYRLIVGLLLKAEQCSYQEYCESAAVIAFFCKSHIHLSTDRMQRHPAKDIAFAWACSLMPSQDTSVAS
jgi:hypothetical protein